MKRQPLPTNALLARIYTVLGGYPILNTRIRAAMRRELFESGLIQPAEFEAQVRELAIDSQKRTGIAHPYDEEPGDTWDFRLNQVRDFYTDLVFSQFSNYKKLEEIINSVLAERGVQHSEAMLAGNPEVSSLEEVLRQALDIERLPLAERARYEARLQELKVVLIRLLISDQLRYISVAKQWFSAEDLVNINRRKIGSGRIGGKAAGMLLAFRILQQSVEWVGTGESPLGCLSVPESYYVGSDGLYTFMAINNLFHWNDQKYKSEAEMRAEYPQIAREFEAGAFPSDYMDQFRELLSQVGNAPLIVRSSSLLEDNFGTAFAGKYDSIFCPNQGTPAENLAALTRAVANIYASTLNPNALLYRRSRGLLDYDERMAVLIQRVEGERFDRYYMPHAAGVAFSRNLYRWTPQIRREDGFVRLVWGLGTRAVDRVGNDYPRLIALSHPNLRPSSDPKSVRRYSQQYVDVLDLETNTFKDMLPIQQVLNGAYPPLRYVAQVDEDGFFSSIRSRLAGQDAHRLVLTFDDLLTRTPFAERMRNLLRLLEQAYRSPVDVEFALRLTGLEGSSPDLCITILQCRPQSELAATPAAVIPFKLKPEDTVFETHFVVPQGYIPRVDYVLFVAPEGYFALPDVNARGELIRAISRLNAALEKQHFICVGPGRWGSSNPDLGVSINYGDIYHAHSLVELAGEGIGLPPEPSLGTHFFQDLLESQIYPLAIYLDDAQNTFDRGFFYQTPNCAADWMDLPAELSDTLRLIRVSDYRPGSHLRVVMDDENSRAVAFLEKD